jgi:hypothetical protein
MAVPSILDGKVYLTSTAEDCRNFMKYPPDRHIDDDDNVDDDIDHFHPGVCDLVEDTVTTTIHHLIGKTPFVDMKNHGRIYTSQRHSVAVAIHSTTGQPIRTITTTSSSSSTKTTTPKDEPSASSSPTVDPFVEIREVTNLLNGDIPDMIKPTADSQSETDHAHTDNENDILWLGRTDYTISVHEPMTGELDVQFTMAEMMSIHDMLLMEDNPHHHHHHPNQHLYQQQQILRQYLLPNTQSKNINREDTDEIVTDQAVSSSHFSSTRTESSIMYGLIATPNGHVAYRHLYTGQIIWVAPETFFNTPAVYAFDAKSGRSLQVDIVPDVIAPHGTIEYVSNELQKQLYQHYSETTSSTGRHSNPYRDVATAMNEPVFGSLPGTGQIYAIPLLQKVPTTSTTPNVGMESTSMMTANTIPDAARAYVSGNTNHNTDMNHYNQYYQQQSHYCHPNSPHYPRCLNYGNYLHSNNNGPDRYNNNHNLPNRKFRKTFPNTASDVSSFHYINRRHDHTQIGRTMDDYDDDTMGTNGAIVPFYHPDYGYQYIPPDHFYTINTEWNEQYRRKKRYKKFMRIVTSWFLPTVVAALFVTVRFYFCILYYVRTVLFQKYFVSTMLTQSIHAFLHYFF